MKTFQFDIIYTSDVHGSLTSLDEASNQLLPKGLSKISTYTKSISTPYMLIDNGDTIQGSPTMDYWIKENSHTVSPINKVMNAMNYRYINIGNHDFNFGVDILMKYTNHLNGTVLCCNILNIDGSTMYQPYDIIEVYKGIKIGIIGAVTHYIPHWEKPNHIKNVVFSNAFETIAKYVAEIRPLVTCLIVLYHGGFEKNPENGEIIGRITDENQGYRIAKELDIDLLLTGHQHFSIPSGCINNTKIMQTSHNATNFGHIEIKFIQQQTRWECSNINTSLIASVFDDDSTINELLHSDISITQKWLDDPIGTIENGNMLIADPFLSRLQTHPIYQFINQVQLSYTNAMISASSLANQAKGFPQQITTRDIAATFVYPNSIYVIEITGKILKAALEKTASYFDVLAGNIVVNQSFIYPKVEHYNYDIYDGIDYTIKVSNPIGSRIISLSFQGEPIKDSQWFSLAINNYRAIGGGDYSMFENAKIIAEFEEPISTIVQNYIREHPILSIKHATNIQIIP
jgi:2',3'-cyclic-nucleotide 2'-phosphodiesterase/3'-nucleotidase